MPGAVTDAAGPSFDAQWLQQRLSLLLGPSPAHWPPLCVAWSGGADSTALLHALCTIRAQILASPVRLPRWRALHVDHQLQPAAREFTAHCRTLAKAWGVPLRVLQVAVDRTGGRSLEEAARSARYAAFAKALSAGEVLLLAQHGDDQLETVLLQCLRGAGVAGLAGMAPRAALGAGELLRPLLPLPAQALRDYLARVQIRCVEDPTNADERYDRNYLRSSVLPPLLARWPAAALTVARSAAHAAEAAALTQTVAARDAAAAADGTGLDMRVLRRYSPERQRAALRSWVLSQGHPLPDQRRLQQLQSLLHLRGDASPRVQWAGTLVQRHGERLLLMQQQTAPLKALVPLCWSWHGQRSVHWPGAGRLSLRADRWGDVDLSRLPAQLWLIARQGGERLMAGGQHRDVKDLIREAQIPDWQRAQLPLICAGSVQGPENEPLLALADVAVADSIKADANSLRRARFIWQRD